MKLIEITHREVYKGSVDEQTEPCVHPRTVLAPPPMMHAKSVSRAAFRVRKVQMKHRQGFSLIELMITISLLAVILGLAVPSFNFLIQSNRATTLANDLMTAITFTRSEAIRRGEAVRLCPSDDGAKCGGSWTDGWITKADSETAPSRVWDAPRSGTVINVTSTVPIEFGPLGNLETSEVSFEAYQEGCSGNHQRIITIEANGASSVTKAACPE
ncbi:MAG: GspH/FimT family pseudopilin [Halothiobacillaceae bacterium]